MKISKNFIGLGILMIICTIATSIADIHLNKNFQESAFTKLNEKTKVTDDTNHSQVAVDSIQTAVTSNQNQNVVSSVENISRTIAAQAQAQAQAQTQAPVKFQSNLVSQHSCIQELNNNPLAFLNMIIEKQNSSFSQIKYVQNIQTTQEMQNRQLLSQTEMPSAGNGHTREGGDFTALEFLTFGKAFIRDLIRFHSRNDLNEINISQIESAMAQYRIDPTTQPIFDSNNIQRDAVTDHSNRTISIYLPSWFLATNNKLFKVSIVVHELLRAGGYTEQDDRYSWTQQIIQKFMDSPNQSYMLNVSSNELDEQRFIEARIRSQYNFNVGRNVFQCSFRTNTTSASTIQVRFVKLIGGMQISFINLMSQPLLFSDILQNIDQVLYGSVSTTFTFHSQAAEGFENSRNKKIILQMMNERNSADLESANANDSILSIVDGGIITNYSGSCRIPTGH